MKKLLSILLAVCMLLTMFTLPALAEVVEDGTYQYHKFDFSEGKDDFNGYIQARTSKADKEVYTDLKNLYTGNSDYYAPISAGDGNYTTPNANEHIKVDYVDFNGKMVMRIRAASNNNYQFVITPHYMGEDGKWTPIRLLPGNSYKVNYTVVVNKIGTDTGYVRIQTEPWVNTAARVFPDAKAPSATYELNKAGQKVFRWRATAVYYTQTSGNGRVDLSSGGTTGYPGHSSLYTTYHNVEKTRYSGFGLTAVPTYSIADGVATDIASTEYGAATEYNNNNTFSISNSLNMLAASGGEGAWDDLADWTVRKKSEACPSEYYYTTNGVENLVYTDHLGIGLTNANTANVYYEVTEANAADVAFPELNVTTTDGKVYARAYNEYLITDLEYYETGKGAVVFGDETVVGTVGAAVVAPTPAAQEGKEFLGWYDAEGNKFESAVFAAGEPKTYTARWASYTDNFSIDGEDITFTQNNTVSGTAVKSDLGMLVKDGDTYRATPLYTNLRKWDDSVDIPYPTVAPALSRATATIGTKVGLPNTIAATTPVGTLKMVSTTGFVSQVATLKDADGTPLLAKANTQYFVRLAYKQLGAGTLDVALGAGRKAANINTAYLNRKDSLSNETAVTGSAFTSGYKTLGAESLDYSTDVQYATYNFTTANFTDGSVPEFNIAVATKGVLGRYTGKHYDDVPVNPNNSSDKWGSNNWGQYEIVGIPEFEIVGIEIIEVESGNTVVAYNDGAAYLEGAEETEIVGAPSNYEDTWYATNASTYKANQLTKFPGKNSVAYDYSDVLENVKYNQRTYIGCRGFSIDEATDKLLYKPYTYDEYYEKYGVTIDGSKALDEALDSVAEATKLSAMKKMYESSIWNMYRLPDVELVDGDTYKVTFKYKADSIAANTKVKFTIATENSAVVAYKNDLDEVVDITEVTNGDWVEKTIYFTADLPKKITEEVEGQDDKFSTLGVNLYVYLNHSVSDVTYTDDAARPVIYFDKFEVENVGKALEVQGASCLKEDVALANNQQAMRVYFSYATDDGKTIKIGDETFNIVARGFVYQYGSLDKYTAKLENIENVYKGDLREDDSITVSKLTDTTKMNQCWDYVDGQLWFSNYIKNFILTTPEKAGMEDYNMIARGYVTFEDANGAQFTVYSKPIKRSINGILLLNDGEGTIENFENSVVQ